MKKIEVIRKGRASKVNVNIVKDEDMVEDKEYTEEDAENMDDIIKEVDVDHIVAELREVTDRDFRRIFLVARQYRKADKMLNKYSPEMLLGGSEND